MTNIRDIPDRYFWCLRGARGHDMELQPITGRWNSWGLAEEYRCTRCSMIRRDVIDATGDISTRWYLKPEGYPGSQWSSAEVRLEAVRRERKRSRKLTAVA